MIVYRLIKYEGAVADIAKMFERSINGEYHPGDGPLKITAAPVEPRTVEQTPMLLHALQQVAGKRWSPPASMTRKASPLVLGSRASDDQQDAAKFIQRVDDMLSDGFGWAEDTLLGIRDTVERTGRVTDGQSTAVDNIENARRDR